jgi:tetratricopeptide (TPR) repeat protein
MSFFQKQNGSGGAPATGDGPVSPPGSIFGRDLSELGFRKALVFLLLLGLIIRVGYFVEHAHTLSFGVPALDEKYYDTVARMLLAGDDLRELHGFRPLLYPMFLAGMYKLGGSWGIPLALVVQHLMGVATGIIVALLGARLFQHRLCGVIGGALFLLAPVPLYFEGELLIEPSYTFLICAGLLLHLYTAGRHGWRSGILWLGCGGLTALTSQARANILIFLAVYPLFTMWRWWHWRKPAALLPLLGLVGALGMMIPWGVVNLRQSGYFHLIPNAGGVNFYLGNKRAADGMVPRQERRIYTGERYQDSVEVWAREEYEAAMRAQNQKPETDPMAISSYWTRRAVAEIQADPGSWLRLMARKSWLMLWNAEVPNNKSFTFLQQEYAWLYWLPVRWVVLLMLAPAGILAAAKRGNRDGLFILLAYVCLYSAGNIAFFVCDRYRYPIWPAMAVIGGGGLLAGVQAIGLRKFRETMWILAGMSLMAVLSLPDWFGTKLPSFARDYQFRSFADYEKGHLPEALNDIDRSIALDPTDATSLGHRGNVLFALNRLEEARDAYELTLKLSPRDAGMWNNLGVTLDALGQTAAALQAFRRAMECQPPSQNAFLGTAFIQVRQGRLAEAAITLDQLDQLKRTPDAAVLAVRSIIERRRGDIRLADLLEQQARTLDANAAAWAIEHATNTAAHP